MKKLIKKEYFRRIRLVLKCELSTTNAMAAINTLAVSVPAITFSLSFINWTIAVIDRLDRKARKPLTIY